MDLEMVMKVLGIAAGLITLWLVVAIVLGLLIGRFLGGGDGD